MKRARDHVVAFAITAAVSLSACGAERTGPDDFLVTPGSTAQDSKADDGGDGPRAELKVTIDAGAIADVRATLGLRRKDGEEREVWFYDTPTLDLYGAGVVLRARKVKDGADDSTVKLRPIEPTEVAPAWLATAGFKCETDHTPARSVASCSLTATQDRGEIDDVAQGARTIDKLFSSAQEAFLDEHAPAFAWRELARLGPTEALVWKITTRSLPVPLTAEWWDLPGGELLELSIKVPADDVAPAFDEFLGWLEARDIPLSDVQETKTRRALEEHAAGWL